MIRLQPDVLENISILNLGFLKLEVINSALSLTGAINEGPMVEVKLRKKT